MGPSASYTRDTIDNNGFAALVPWPMVGLIVGSLLTGWSFNFVLSQIHVAIVFQMDCPLVILALTIGSAFVSILVSEENLDVITRIIFLLLFVPRGNLVCLSLNFGADGGIWKGRIPWREAFVDYPFACHEAHCGNVCERYQAIDLIVNIERIAQR